MTERQFFERRITIRAGDVTIDGTLNDSQTAEIVSVLFMRPAAVTHANNMSQRHVPLSFIVGPGGRLRATVPSNPNVAPPGYYMLFIVDGDGVPAEGSFVHLVP